MRAWITSLLAGILVISTVVFGRPGAVSGAQPTAPIVFGSVVAEGSIYLTSTVGLHAVDLTTGVERWRLATPPRARSQPTVADGIVYFISDPDPPAQWASLVHAVNASDGHELWTFEAEGTLPQGDRGLTGPVLVSDGKVYVFASPRVTVLDAAAGLVDGSPVATAFLPIGQRFVAAHENRVLLAGTFSQDVGCVDLASGAQLWTAPVTTDHFFAPSTSDDDTLFLGDEDNTVVALDWATGQQRWAAPSSTISGGKFIRLEGGVVVVDRGDDVEGIDPADGSTRWLIPVPNGSADAATFRDGTLSIATDEPTIDAVDVESGLPRWTLPLPARVSALWLDADDALTAVLVTPAGATATGPVPNLMQVDSATGELIWSLTLAP